MTVIEIAERTATALVGLDVSSLRVCRVSVGFQIDVTVRTAGYAALGASLQVSALELELAQFDLLDEQLTKLRAQLAAALPPSRLPM